MDNRQKLLELLADRVSLENKGKNPLDIKISFTGSDFSQIDLRGANLMNSEFKQCNFTGSHLDGCLLSGLVWGCVFEGTTFNKAIFSDIHFIECNFNDANFSNVLFNQCHLSPPSSFVNATFSGAILDGLQISQSEVKQLDLKDAIIGGNVLRSTNKLENAKEYIRLRQQLGEEFLKAEAIKKVKKAEEEREPYKEMMQRQYRYTFYSRELINVCKYALSSIDLDERAASNRQLNSDALKMINNHDLSLSAVDEEGHSAYYYAINNGWTNVVRRMIEKGGVDTSNRPSKTRQQIKFKEDAVPIRDTRVYIVCFTHGDIETYNNDDATFGYHTFTMPEGITLKYVSFTTPGNICCMDEKKNEGIIEDIKDLKDQTESKPLERIDGDIHSFAKKVENNISCLFKRPPDEYIDRYHRYASQEGYSRVVTVKPGEEMVNKGFSLKNKLMSKFDFRINIVGHESIDIADIFGKSVTLENLMIFLKMHSVTEVFFADFSCSVFSRVTEEKDKNMIWDSLKASKTKYGGLTKRRIKRKSIKKMRIKKSRRNKKCSKK
jgi:uncharacterized protein YjbI with pentapeptide repeats